MDTMNINKSIDKNSYSFSLEPGNVYLISTDVSGIHQDIFHDVPNVVFINSPFDYAIKIDPYIERNKISKKSISKLQSSYDFQLPVIDSYGILNRLSFIILKQLLEKDLLIIELSGLANDSIAKLQKYA